jgi:hypothetical protein
VNRDPEKMLRDAPRSRVPESLDLRVDALLRRVELEPPAPGVWRLPLWVATAACILCTVLGYAMYPVLQPPDPAMQRTPVVVYVEQPAEELPAALGGHIELAEGRFFERQHGNVTFIGSAKRRSEP